MQTFLSSTPYSERVRPLLGVQFLGVFNDNAFKMLAILAVILGVQLFLAGFLGELINRGSSDRNKYLIDRKL